jgi:hypothetical protein
MAWNKDQVRGFVKQAKAEVGAGWSLLGPRLQEALIADRALRVITSQAADTVRVDAVEDLRRDMLREAGLLEAIGEVR